MDERLANIKKEKENAITQSNNIYDELLNENQNIYNKQNEFAEKQNQILDETLDKQLAFQQKTIESQKNIAYQNKSTEDKKAKNDYTSFVNPYGNNAESLATNGLNNSGVSETSKLGGWNTYQNRLANNNKVLQDAITQYDFTMDEARVTNDVQKAQNALKKLELKLSYIQDFYNNKTTLSQNKLSNNQSIDSEYHNRYQQEYQNIQNEKAQEEAARQWQAEMSERQRQWDAEMAEKQRQYNESMSYQQERDRVADQQWQKEFAASQKAAAQKRTSSSKSSSTSLSGGSSTKQIKTNYYSGDINPDCQYGTMSVKDKNGTRYQPDNVGGNKLSQAKTSKGKGLKVSDIFYDAHGSSGADLSNQKIYQAGSSYYVWDGSVNSYIDVTSQTNESINRGVCLRWGR